MERASSDVVAWIELHQSLPNHRKTLRLQSLLGLKPAQAVGHLCLIWLWALDNVKDGDLAGLSNRELATVAGYSPRKADEFVDALEKAGFLDRTGEGLRIHDWEDYAGRLLEIKAKNKQRALASRERARNVRAACANAAELPDPTQPDQTLPDPTKPNSDSPFYLPDARERLERNRGSPPLAALEKAREDGHEGDWPYISQLLEQFRKAAAEGSF